MKDAPVVEAMRCVSGQYPRFGSRRIRVFLNQEGLQIGQERCSRLWWQAGLQVPAKRKRRRAVASSQPRPCLPTGRSSVWSYDFVYDACANGQTLKCLTVVDEYTRECLAIDVAGSIRAKRVIEVLSRLVSLHGAPKYLRSDNGPEFFSTQYESFNGKYRDECLSMEWLRNWLEARVITEEWRRHRNEIAAIIQAKLPRRKTVCGKTEQRVNNHDLRL